MAANLFRVANGRARPGDEGMRDEGKGDEENGSVCAEFVCRAKRVPFADGTG